MAGNSELKILYRWEAFQPPFPLPAMECGEAPSEVEEDQRSL